MVHFQGRLFVACIKVGRVYKGRKDSNCYGTVVEETLPKDAEGVTFTKFEE